MTKFSRKNTMAALFLAAATVGLPTTSFADPAKSSYRNNQDCREADREGQLIGGLVGAVAGGVAGREIAGRGDRTEGSAIGAVIGAVAGASIANKDCDDRGYRRTYGNNTNYTYGNTSRTTGYNNTYYGGNTYNTGHSRGNSQWGHSRGNQRGHNHGNHSNNWGFRNNSHVCSSGETRQQHVEWQIRELRRERDYLADKRRYVRYDQRIDRRIHQIGNELEDLKRELKYLKKHRNNRSYDRDYRRNTYYYKTKR